MGDEDDIGSEWGTIKSVPKAKAQTPDVENIRMDILDVRQAHPEFIYRVHEGYGIDSMALWRCRCLAKRVLAHGLPGRPLVKEVFIYQLDDLLVAGKKFSGRPEVEGHTYSSPCKAFQVTLTEALAEWEVVRQRHIATERAQAKRYREEAAERLQWAREIDEKVKAAEKNPLTVEDFLNEGYLEPI